jgi:hypothetical protein
MQWIFGPLFLGVKWPVCKTDHILQSSAEVKNGGTIPPLPYTPLWSGELYLCYVTPTIRKASLSKLRKYL